MTTKRLFGPKSKRAQEIGRRIRALRRNRKLTQQALADATNCSDATISKIELGQINARLEQVEAIADALGISVPGLYLDDAPQAKAS